MASFLIKIHCDCFHFKVIVYDREKESRKFFFPCNQWLAKDEGDGMISRQLSATNDSAASFQGTVFASFPLELYLIISVR